MGMRQTGSARSVFGYVIINARYSWSLRELYCHDGSYGGSLLDGNLCIANVDCLLEQDYILETKSLSRSADQGRRVALAWTHFKRGALLPAPSNFINQCWRARSGVVPPIRHRPWAGSHAD